MDGIARVNFTRNRRQELVELVEAAIRRRLFPGMELLVARGDETLLHEAWGTLEVGPEAPPMRPGTVFDIASLTKPLATATALLILLEQGVLGLEDKAADFFPEFDSPDKRGITLRHLLTHTSGLPDWADLYSEAQTPAEALQKLTNVPLKHPTGTAMVYSDLGYLLLGEVVRRAAGQSLGETFHQHIAHPLQLRHTAFKPLEQDWEPPIAPTQYCTFRQMLLRGIVHDENAYAFGGEAGNAGLFSTAADLHRFARMILHQGELDGVRLLARRTVEVMTANHNPPRLAPRGLGWDIKGDTYGYTSCGALMRRGSIGHTGFTGCSLWMEPDTGLIVALLSNRVHISRDRNQADMVRFRPRLHNLVVCLFGE
jgi:CubicO group peptidase (beta-lactamase class C family)